LTVAAREVRQELLALRMLQLVFGVVLGGLERFVLGG
jgi:hypothetical protein